MRHLRRAHDMIAANKDDDIIWTSQTESFEAAFKDLWHDIKWLEEDAEEAQKFITDGAEVQRHVASEQIKADVEKERIKAGADVKKAETTADVQKCSIKSTADVQTEGIKATADVQKCSIKSTADVQKNEAVVQGIGEISKSTTDVGVKKCGIKFTADVPKSGAAVETTNPCLPPQSPPSSAPKPPPPTSVCKRSTSSKKKKSRSHTRRKPPPPTSPYPYPKEPDALAKGTTKLDLPCVGDTLSLNIVRLRSQKGVVSVASVTAAADSGELPFWNLLVEVFENTVRLENYFAIKDVDYARRQEGSKYIPLNIKSGTQIQQYLQGCVLGKKWPCAQFMMGGKSNVFVILYDGPICSLQKYACLIFPFEKLHNLQPHKTMYYRIKCETNRRRSDGHETPPRKKQKTMKNITPGSSLNDYIGIVKSPK